MDPRDQQRALPDGMPCTVCDEPVPAGSIRLLARRDDLTFVELACSGCGSTSLEFVMSKSGTELGPPAAAAVVGDWSGSAPVISYADVRAMREFLDTYRGDTRGLVERLHGSGRSSRRGWSVDRGRRR